MKESYVIGIIVMKTKPYLLSKILILCHIWSYSKQFRRRSGPNHELNFSFPTVMLAIHPVLTDGLTGRLCFVLHFPNSSQRFHIMTNRAGRERKLYQSNNRKQTGASFDK